MPSFRNINCMQLVLAVVTIMSHLSSADFECQFGSRSWNRKQFFQCSIESTTWGTVSGHGNNGNAPSGKKNDGFFITDEVNSQNQAIFQLPNLNLTDHSGSLSFYYKFFNPGTSTLNISFCGRLRTITAQSKDNWENITGILIYCNGQRPTVQFTAVWNFANGRIGVDNINIVSTRPPITTTKATTTKATTTTATTTTTTTTTATPTLKSTTTTAIHPTYTTTPMTTAMMTSMTTSELSTFTSQSAGSDSALSVTTENLTTVPLVLTPTRLEARRHKKWIVAAGSSVLGIVLVIIALVVAIKRAKTRQSSKVIRDDPGVTMTSSLERSPESVENIYETGLSNVYETLEGPSPVQESVQASNGDSEAEEMVVNILYQSVDGRRYDVRPCVN